MMTMQMHRRVRPGRTLDLTLFLLALLTLASVINFVAQRPGLRVRVDATRTRAYALSPQTDALLAGLDGRWTIALVQVASETNASVQDQVDEVLRRYEAAQPELDVIRVDPTDPATIPDYERLVDRIRAIEADAIASYESALDEGEAAFSELLVFAQQQSAQLETAVATATGEERATLRQHLTPLTLLAREGGKVVEAVAKARDVGATRPLPDYETARSILGTGLGEWANELDAMATVYDGWRATSRDPMLTALAAAIGPRFTAMSERLLRVVDPLEQLPPLEAARIGRELETGEAAIVIGPAGAAVVPGRQLFPRLNLRQTGSGAVAFDRRFRGEQVISAAIRSLQVERMPLVVFVHAEERPMLRENGQAADVRGVGEQLAASRFDVREWSVGRTERPFAEANQPVVYIVLPPQARTGLEPEPRELNLIRTTKSLLESGEAVMVNVHPSQLPRYRQPDPWANVLEPFGLTPRTGEALFESVQIGETFQIQGGLVADEFDDEHAVARAVSGQQLFLSLPVGIDVDLAFGVATRVVAAAAPNPRRWSEANWLATMSAPEAPARLDAPLTVSVPLVVTAERTQSGGAPQRVMLVGSGGWMLSFVADAYQTLGGDRVALQNPGNAELMLASVAWLAGMDDLIAPSPLTRQASRLEGLTSADQVRWGGIAVLGVPLFCLVFGGVVGLVRRRG